ncbi:uncharacterized protein (UPF0548 family) [Catenuloplanes nepalensis]|uniref:Uncharacterized protein (UPF0548 family) n=1 Tax=Catenuloplanes nepalensis TaxID=587533 RepID=A0ABT9MTX4_9ACTN|nr:DUF1990 domain-containing protein [Catenuloplanes nepalensis]MDP9794888.1 uncharacterized protein (UPF0548 family) [Catenuloplanes nepalensis]
MRRAMIPGLAAAPLTYEEAGATRAEPMPGGYHHVHRDVSIGRGPEDFARAATALLTWRMHEAAGLSVIHADGPAAPGAVVVLQLPPRFLIPCRVVYTVDEPGRRGFAYGTLPGHPESGEEAFIVILTDAGDVRIHIRAFSRPATLMTRAAGPINRLVQRYATDRYVSALQRLARTG